MLKLWLALIIGAFISTGAVPADVEQITTQKATLSALRPGEFKVNTISALNTKSGQTLVIWQKHPNNHCCHSLHSRLLNPSGGPVGGETTLVSGPNTYNPSIVYNEARNEFVLVYANEVNGQLFAIYAQRLTPQGRLTGAAVKVSAENPRDGYVADYPEIALDAVSNTYVVAWQRHATRANLLPDGIQGIRLNAGLQPVGAQMTVANEPAGNGFAPHPIKVSVQPAGGRIFVLYSLFSQGGTAVDYYLARSGDDLTGVVLSRITPKPILTSLITTSADMFFLPDGAGAIFYEHHSGIKKRRFDATGRFVGAITPAFRPPVGASRMSYPTAAVANTGIAEKRFLFAVQNPHNATGGAPSILWIQPLNSAGAPDGPPQRADTNAQSMSGVRAISLPRLPGGARFRFGGVYTSGNASGAGLVLLRMLYEP